MNERMLRTSAHVVVYFIFGALAWMAFQQLLVVPGVVIIAVLDEATKRFIKGRHCSLKEMGLNVVGAVLGVALCVAIAMMFQASTVKAADNTAENQRPDINRAVFVWGDKDGTAVDQRLLDNHKIDTVFQAFADGYAVSRDGNGKITMSIDKTRVKQQMSGIQTFHLCGYHDWGADEMELAAQVTEQSGLFTGLALDIEPRDKQGNVVYTEKFTSDIETACASTDYPIYVVIPYWLDEALMERVVKAADGIILMDYCVIKDEAGNYQQRRLADNAMKFCTRYNKPLIIAFELQKDQSDYISFRGDVELAEAVFKNQFGDTDVGFALHTIKELR